jgi:hypothetical protein
MDISQGCLNVMIRVYRLNPSLGDLSANESLHCRKLNFYLFLKGAQLIFTMRITVLVIFISLFFYSCSSDENVPEARSYQMGFQNSAPRFDNLGIFLQSLNIWTIRADAAIISVEVPWKELLTGENTVEHVVNNYKGLAEYYRTKNLTLWMYIDPQNGLDRTSDALDLVAVGKSISQPAMQEIYKRFVVVMDSVLRPEHVGLALETNLIRSAASPAKWCKAGSK